MRKNLKSSNGPNRFFSQLAAEKKKSVTALCLVAVMAFMWVRVLFRRTPQAAAAASMTEEMNVEGKSNPELKISFIELPEVAGRNDVITRDFFASDGWQDFVGREVENLVGTEEVNIVSKGGNEEGIRRVAEQLKLEAIVLSNNPQAFINDKLLSVGDKLPVGEEVDSYECEVVEIKRDTVVVRCGEAEIMLKLTQAPIIDR
ncbi:MAG: hypothetical protein ACYS9C_03225 [Planctomycetota bacterium]|jgi:hypothetical protein